MEMRVLIMVGVLAVAAHASAACRWFGTQLECGVATSRVVIGTQAAYEPIYARSFPIHPFQGGSGLREDRAVPGRRFEIDLQDVGADPRLCRKIGNETYCY
jgi:hypothetical protein